jgi:OOP family OmpA-OmpF porin
MRAIAVVALALLASPALAQEGIYVGLGLGSFSYEEDSAFLAPGPFEDSVSSWKIYGGFEFNENFGFEVRYGATEEFEQTFSGMDQFLGNFSTTFDVGFTTTSLVGMGFLPNDWGTLFGGIGYFDTDIDADFVLESDNLGTITDELSIGDDGLMAVLGIEWRFGRFGTGVGVRIEYEWLDAEDADASTVGVGVSYRF